MKLGCSYFGNRILRHVREDLREMRDMGCTFVVHTFNENDMTFYAKTMAEIVEASHEMDLEVYIDPWGVGKVFGGESFSNFVMQNTDALQMISDGKPTGAACPNSPKFRSFIREWVDAAAGTGADVIFWDEPHFYLPAWLGGRPDTWGCMCETCQKKFEETMGKPFPKDDNEDLQTFKQASLLEFLSEAIAYAHQKGKKNALCVLPLRGEQHDTGNWERMASIPHLNIFGTDPYWYAFKEDLCTFVGNSSCMVKEICDSHGLEGQLWLQGYKVPAGREEELVQATQLMTNCGITNIAVWGFDACNHISWIRPDNPQLAWAKIKEAFAKVRDL